MLHALMQINLSSNARKYEKSRFIHQVVVCFVHQLQDLMMMYRRHQMSQIERAL